MALDFSNLELIQGAQNIYINKIPSNLYKKFIHDAKLPNNASISFMWKCTKSNEGLAVTDDYIVQLTATKKALIYHFDNLSRVYFSPDQIFYLYDLNGDRCGTIEAHFFGLSNEAAVNDFNRNLIKEFFNDRIRTGGFVASTAEFCLQAIDRIEKLGDIGEIVAQDLDIKLDYADKIISIYDDFHDRHGHRMIYYNNLERYLAIAMCLKGEHFESLKIIDNIIKDDELPEPEYWYSLRGSILAEMKEWYTAMIWIKKAYDISKIATEKLEYQKNIRELKEKMRDNFLDMHPSERKVVLIADEINSIPKNSFTVLDKNFIPDGLIFSNGTYEEYQLYIAHPIVANTYIPISDYNANLAVDKFDEFFYFVQCLGAKSISYRKSSGASSTQQQKQEIKVDGKLAVGKGLIKPGVNGNYSSDKQLSTNIGEANSRFKTQTFNPNKKPYIPTGLNWYPNDINWHRLYQQRIEGNILSHHEVINSNSIKGLTSIENTNVKAAFKNFFVDAEVNYHKLVEDNFNQSNWIEVEILIDFESIENLQDNISDTENEYLTEAAFMLEDDGLIDDRERAALERLRTRKGISRERALELEKNITRNNPSKEDEYREEYIALRKSGILSKRDRQWLLRTAERLKIDSSRINEIENAIEESYA
ncbi:MAG: hypothetical protein EOO51_08485 [Flavobacterium sp.]|nr:MAG: hypothetical protein EOO51_08485 [Flavobacterium sp.]